MLDMNALTAGPSLDSPKNGNGQWKKGSSGNPAGRPRGSRNRAAIIMEQLLDGQIEQLVQKLVASALEGNMQAMGICVERVLPRCKERTIDFDIPPVVGYDDILRAACTILEGIARGDITPTEGEKLSNVLKLSLESRVAVDLECRLTEVERELFPKQEETEERVRQRVEQVKSCMALAGLPTDETNAHQERKTEQKGDLE